MLQLYTTYNFAICFKFTYSSNIYAGKIDASLVSRYITDITIYAIVWLCAHGCTPEHGNIDYLLLICLSDFMYVTTIHTYGFNEISYYNSWMIYVAYYTCLTIILVVKQKC